MATPAVEDVAGRAARSLCRQWLVDWSTEQYELLPHELILSHGLHRSRDQILKAHQRLLVSLVNLTIHAPPFNADVKKGSHFHKQRSSINES